MEISVALTVRVGDVLKCSPAFHYEYQVTEIKDELGFLWFLTKELVTNSSIGWCKHTDFSKILRHGVNNADLFWKLIDMQSQKS